MRIGNCQYCQPNEVKKNKNLTMRVTAIFCYIVCETCKHVVAGKEFEKVLEEWNKKGEGS